MGQMKSLPKPVTHVQRQQALLRVCVLQDLDPYIVLEPDTPAIRNSVKQSLALALAGVEPGSLAYYDDMVRAIDRAAGEQHHRLFVSDGLGGFGPFDTLVGTTSLLVPGTITWTEPP